MSKSKTFLRLTAQRKLELYLATRDPQAPLGEILRQYNVHLDDLREIERTIESAAMAALKVKGRHGRLPEDVSPARVLQLEQELAEKTSALAELSVAFTLLEKKDRAESLARRQAKPSPRKPVK
jgi:hypothetical protein